MEDAILHSFKWLSEVDIFSSVSLTCRLWYELSSSTIVWKSFFEHRFGLHEDALCNFKDAYMQRVQYPQRGDKLEVAWHGKFHMVQHIWFYGLSWWEASIVDIVQEEEEEGRLRYKVHYPGWNDRWDEWVSPARLRWPAPSYSTQGLRVGPGEEPLSTEEQLQTFSNSRPRSHAFPIRIHHFQHRNPFSFNSQLQEVVDPEHPYHTERLEGPLVFEEWLLFYDKTGSLAKHWNFSLGCPRIRDSALSSKTRMRESHVKEGSVVEVWWKGTRVKGGWLEAQISIIEFDRVQLKDFAVSPHTFWTTWSNVRPVKTRVITGKPINVSEFTHNALMEGHQTQLARGPLLGSNLRIALQNLAVSSSRLSPSRDVPINQRHTLTQGCCIS